MANVSRLWFRVTQVLGQPKYSVYFFLRFINVNRECNYGCLFGTLKRLITVAGLGVIVYVLYTTCDIPILHCSITRNGYVFRRCGFRTGGLSGGATSVWTNRVGRAWRPLRRCRAAAAARQRVRPRRRSCRPSRGRPAAVLPARRTPRGSARPVRPRSPGVWAAVRTALSDR